MKCTDYNSDQTNSDDRTPWHPKVSPLFYFFIFSPSSCHKGRTANRSKLCWTFIVKEGTYIRILRGRFNALNSEANFRTDAIEQRSNSMTSIIAEGISFNIASLTTLPLETFRTAITTCTPLSASTRAVSIPIPLDAPTISSLLELDTNWNSKDRRT